MRSPKRTQATRLRYRATHAVRRAIAAGELAPLDGQECADCGEPAWCYDHRDYTKPLQVEPVCKACNNRRGPGYPLPDFTPYHNGVGRAGHRWGSLETQRTGNEKVRVSKIEQAHIDPIGDPWDEPGYFTNLRDFREHNRRRLDAIREGFEPLKTLFWSGEGRGEFFKQHDPYFFDADAF